MTIAPTATRQRPEMSDRAGSSTSRGVEVSIIFDDPNWHASALGPNYHARWGTGSARGTACGQAAPAARRRCTLTA